MTAEAMNLLGATHEVFNQPPPLENYNLYDTDTALREAVRREGGEWGEGRQRKYGALTGGELMALGFQANVNKPKSPRRQPPNRRTQPTGRTGAGLRPGDALANERSRGPKAARAIARPKSERGLGKKRCTRRRSMSRPIPRTRR